MPNQLPAGALDALKQKGGPQTAATPQPTDDDTPQNAPAAAPGANQGDASADDGDSDQDDEAVAGTTVNLKSAYSKLQEALIKLADESGVRRSATCPYILGAEMSEHVNAVGQAVSTCGGLNGNLILSAHHSSGAGYHSDQGHSVSFPAEKMRQVTITPKNENAKAAVDAAKSYVKKISWLLGKGDPTIQTAQSQLKIVGSRDMAGMTLFDAVVGLINIVHRPSQAVQRAHNGQKSGGHSAHLRGPEAQEESAQ